MLLIVLRESRLPPLPMSLAFKFKKTVLNKKMQLIPFQGSKSMGEVNHRENVSMPVEWSIQRNFLLNYSLSPRENSKHYLRMKSIMCQLSFKLHRKSLWCQRTVMRIYVNTFEEWKSDLIFYFIILYFSIILSLKLVDIILRES